MGKLVTHQSVWIPGMFGGVTPTTLCGRMSEISAAAADMNVGDDVTCKNCLSIISGDRMTFRKRYLGMGFEEVEALAAKTSSN